MKEALDVVCIVVEGGIGIVAVRFGNLVAGNSVTCNREVKSFVSQRDGESVGYIGVRVADEGLIAVIDNAVVVQILENHVAGLSAGHDNLFGV